MIFWLKPFGLHLVVEGGLKSASIDQMIPRFNKYIFANSTLLLSLTLNL